MDELFDRNADSRLLERRRREELGLEPPTRPPSAMPARFGPESMLGDGVPLAAPRGAMLRVGLDARPKHELIPGAVVTVVVEVGDDGDTDADEVTVRVSVPPGADPVLESFARDDVPVDGIALLGEGLRIGTIPAASFVRVRFTARVLPGTDALDVAAHAAAPGVPAVSGPALRLTRRAGHAAFDAPRPFFELEAGESADDDSALDEAVDVRIVDALVDQPAVPDVPPASTEASQTPEAAHEERAEAALPDADADSAERPLIAAPPSFKLPAHLIARPPEPQAAPEPEPTGRVGPPRAEPNRSRPPRSRTRTAEPVPESPPAEPRALRGGCAPSRSPRTEPVIDADPVTEAEPAALEVEPEPEPVAAPVPALLARVLDADEVRALERVFVGAVPHGLAALALLSSVAAADGPLGRALGVAAFARSVAAALPRALVAARMNRPTPAVVTPEALKLIAPAATAPYEEIPYEGALLVARLDARDLEALRNVLARNLVDPFLRGVQILLAVAPRAVEGVPSEAAELVRGAIAGVPRRRRRVAHARHGAPRGRSQLRPAHRR